MSVYDIMFLLHNFSIMELTFKYGKWELWWQETFWTTVFGTYIEWKWSMVRWTDRQMDTQKDGKYSM